LCVHKGLYRTLYKTVMYRPRYMKLSRGHKPCMSVQIVNRRIQYTPINDKRTLQVVLVDYMYLH